MKIFYTAILLIFSVLSCTNSSSTDSETTEFVNIEHGIVFHQDGKYGGWPANNGIWIWDNEILVGFVEVYKHLLFCMVLVFLVICGIRLGQQQVLLY